MDQTNEATSASGRRLEANHEENADSPVGYGKPPKHGRFKPGQSGNKRGRPRGSKNRKTILMQIANETHRVIENGRPRDRKTLDLMLLGRDGAPYLPALCGARLRSSPEG